jgi:hypothetical protein
MVADDSDELVAFHDVTILQATPPALLCRIGGEEVWLPRRHLAGKLWCAGDRGTLFVRYRVAREHRLLGFLGAAALFALNLPTTRHGLLAPLHLVRADGAGRKHLAH